MAVRKIVRIDEEKCDGCGQCVPSCAEGAIQIIDGKAKLISDSYCDGLGACLGQCPLDAIQVIEREAVDFDEEAVAAHLATQATQESLKVSQSAPPHHGGCPGSQAQSLKPGMRGLSNITTGSASQLRNWPVQLHLAPVEAPYFENADLLIAADCAPFAFADFHGQFIAGKTLLIGCPKLDETSVYVEKLSQIFSLNPIKSVEIAFMEVPCCFGLVGLVKDAVAASPRNIPVRLVKLGIRGTIEGTFELPTSQEQPV